MEEEGWSHKLGMGKGHASYSSLSVQVLSMSLVQDSKGRGPLWTSKVFIITGIDQITECRWLSLTETKQKIMGLTLNFIDEQENNKAQRINAKRIKGWV